MVLNRRQVVFGVSVLLLGLCCALPFQKTRTQPPISDAQDSGKSADEFIWVPDGVTLQVPGQAQSSPATSLYQEGSQEDQSPPVRPPRILKHANLATGTSAQQSLDDSNTPLRPDGTLPVDSSLETRPAGPIRSPNRDD